MASTTKQDAPTTKDEGTKTETKETREGKQTAAKERKHEERFPGLSDEQRAIVARLARPAVAPCICGCGGTTKGRFVPGHDAILKERLRNTPGSEEIVAALGWS